MSPVSPLGWWSVNTKRNFDNEIHFGWKTLLTHLTYKMHVFDHTYMHTEDSQHVHKKTAVESIEVMSDNLTYFRTSTLSRCACTIYKCTMACWNINSFTFICLLTCSHFTIISSISRIFTSHVSATSNFVSSAYFHMTLVAWITDYFFVILNPLHASW